MFPCKFSGIQFFRFLLARNEGRFLPCSKGDISAEQQKQRGSMYLKYSEWDI